MSTNESSGGLRFVRHRKPNDPPPKDPYFGGSFDYIEGGENSKHRHRGHRHEEEDGGREKDRPRSATIAKERRKHREWNPISSEAIAENHHEQIRRAAPQTPVPLSGDRGAPSGHGRGESDTGSYIRERPGPSRHVRGESDTGSYVRERPASNEHSRGKKVVSFKERPATSRYGHGESDIVYNIRERPGPSEYSRGQRVLSYSRERPAPSGHGRGESDTGSYVRERPAPSRHGRGESDTGSYVRERPGPSGHSYGERVVSFKERPAPSRHSRGESDIVYNINERPSPSEYGRGERVVSYSRERPAPSRYDRGARLVSVIRERPAPSEHGRGERVVSYSRERPAPSRHGRGESDIVTYIRERHAAEQPQRADAHQMAGDRAPSLNLGRDSGLPAWRAPNPAREKPAPPVENQVVGNPKSPPTPRRNPKPKKTPSQDNRGHGQPETRLYKRVVDPPSLAGFSRFVSPPFSCNKSIDFSPPRGKYEMSGALQSPSSAERRPRSPAKRERLASNSDIVRNQHRGNRHSGNSNGSNGSARRQGPTVQINQNLSVVLEGHRGSWGKGRLNVKE